MGEEGRYRVLRTGADRGKTHGHYIVVVHPDVAVRERLHRFAMVQHRLADDNVLAAPCRVLTSTDLGGDELATDQTVRNAIGIPYDYPDDTRTDVTPLTVGPLVSFASWAAHVLGSRHVLMRVGKAHTPDMEKELSRIPSDAFALLGLGEAEQVVLEACNNGRLARLSIRAYQLPSSVDEQRARYGARYPDSRTMLGVDPDIWPIYLDKSARTKLNVEPLDVVRVRRNVWMLFLRSLRFTFVAAAVSLLGLVSLLEDKAIAAVVAVALALALTLIDMRARPRSSSEV